MCGYRGAEALCARSENCENPSAKVVVPRAAREGEKWWDTHFLGQLQHFMILWAIIEYCDLKVGNISTSCFYAPRTRTDVPGDTSGPLYCVVFAVFGSRVFPHPFFIFATACSCRFHVFHTTYPFPPGPHLKYLSTCEYSFVPP